MKDCNQGFVAYQKKAEYGTSFIYADNYDTDNVKYLYTLAPRCTLKLNGRIIVGE